MNTEALYWIAGLVVVAAIAGGVPAYRRRAREAELKRQSILVGDLPRESKPTSVVRRERENAVFHTTIAITLMSCVLAALAAVLATVVADLSWLIGLALFVVIFLACKRLIFFGVARIYASKLAKLNDRKLVIIRSAGASEDSRLAEEHEARFRAASSVAVPAHSLGQLDQQIEIAKQLHAWADCVRPRLSANNTNALKEIQTEEQRLLARGRTGIGGCHCTAAEYKDHVLLSQRDLGSSAVGTFWCPRYLCTITTSWPLYKHSPR